jgi:methyltransferase (TIGR00027 family)
VTHLVRNVSDTALWVAMYRAMETDRPDALFRDPFARRLAGERGETIVRTVPKAKTFAWPMIVRTAVMDEIILRQIDQGVTTIINLAAGLDARAFRLPLPASLRWLDVDLPDMTDYRREQFADAVSTCVHEHIAADLADPDALTSVMARAAGDGVALIVTEGLLVYLIGSQVAAIARAAHAQPRIRWWLSDLATPAVLELMKKSWKPTLAKANAPMQFAPEDSRAFFEPLGWHEVEFRSMWTESLRLKRSVPLAPVWNALMRLAPARRRAAQLRMSGMVLFERLED